MSANFTRVRDSVSVRSIAAKLASYILLRGMLPDPSKHVSNFRLHSYITRHFSRSLPLNSGSLGWLMALAAFGFAPFLSAEESGDEDKEKDNQKW